MKVFKAYFLRWCHCFKGTFLLNPPHQMVTVTNDILLFGWLPVWRVTHYIGCTCGKVYYDKK
jgi:hypothetical protein